ncbi:MAG: NADH-quinone oxidoreductase subunit NuoH [Gemmatimonadota bacterium]|nr:NADH-quinone oxidoreductase subunit NuoH [Gemmatimonadota bacterium]
MTHTLPFLLQVVDPQLPMSDGMFALVSLIKVAVVFGIYMGCVAYTTFLERRVAAWIQDRHGPNRVGPQGIFQVLADGVKNFMKEETLPGGASKVLFILAPALAFIPAMLTWAVIPFASPLPIPGVGLVDMVVADLPVGFLFTLAIGSLGVYGITIAGWSSNNKYALLGGLRASAQMISYEIAMGMSTVCVLLLAGNVHLNTIIMQQASQGWNVALLTMAFFIFAVAALAETNRVPFDLPEAESELVAGYHAEYSSMRYSMFPIAEYANIITSSSLMIALFFGGWDIPFTQWDNLPPWTITKTLLTMGLYVGKVIFFVFTFIWLRWTLPRFRYDQLMAIGWKVLLPMALVYITAVASAVLGLDAAGLARGSYAFRGAMLGMNVVFVVLVFWVLDRGRIVSPAFSRVERERIAKLRDVSARSDLLSGKGA